MKDGGFLSIPNIILIVFALENISDLKKKKSMNYLWTLTCFMYLSVLNNDTWKWFAFEEAT